MIRDLPSEQELWHSFKSGDRVALGLIFEKYYPLLHHYGMKLCGEVELTEDLLQDFFLYLYEHREKLSDLHVLRAYLFTSFRRMLLRKLKSRDAREGALYGQGNHDFLSFLIEEVSIDQDELDLRRDMIARTLNKLSGRQREVIYLKYYNDMSLQEIAAVMAITYQGVANTLWKAIRVLRRDTVMLKIRELGLLFLAIGIWLT